MTRTRLTVPLLTLVLAAWAVSGDGGTCPVPGSHATIQEAVGDPACGQIQLAAGTFEESVAVHRSLEVAGQGADATLLRGALAAIAPGIEVLVSDLSIDSGCPAGSLQSSAGGRIEAMGVEAVSSPSSLCPPLVNRVFADGFESGDLGAWSGLALKETRR